MISASKTIRITAKAIDARLRPATTKPQRIVLRKQTI